MLVFEAAARSRPRRSRSNHRWGRPTGSNSSPAGPDPDPSGRPRHARCRVGSAAGLGDGFLGLRRDEETLQPTVYMNTIPALEAALLMCSTRCSQRRLGDLRSRAGAGGRRGHRDADLSPPLRGHRGAPASGTSTCADGVHRLAPQRGGIHRAGTRRRRRSPYGVD